MRDGFLVIERDAWENMVPAQSGNTPEIPDGLIAGLPVTGAKIRGLHRVITCG
jgi:hypothetical protein